LGVVRRLLSTIHNHKTLERVLVYFLHRRGQMRKRTRYEKRDGSLLWYSSPQSLIENQYILLRSKS